MLVLPIGAVSIRAVKDPQECQGCLTEVTFK